MKFSIVLIFQKTASLLLLFFIAQQLLNFPVFKTELIAALIVYIIALSIYSKLWLIILPAILPILDLSPWSGRYLITEFDLFILTSLSISLFFARIDFSFTHKKGNIKWLILFMLISYSISTIIGFVSLKQADDTAFYLYLNEYNSLRVAKGFFLALLLLPVLSYEKKQAAKKTQSSNISKLFSLGMLIGLTLVIGSIVWERLVFTGLFDFSRNYRASGLFSGMRLGGIMLDAYLFLTLPFILLLLYRFKSAWVHFLAIIIFAGSIYSILVTYTRINYLAIIIVMLFLYRGSLYLHQSSFKITGIHYLSLMLITLFISISIFQGGYITQRFANTVNNFEQRIGHWKNVLQLTQSNLPTIIFGQGIGSYPSTYIKNNDLKKDKSSPKLARFWLKEESTQNTSLSFLRFSPSDQDNLNVVQRFSVNSPDDYTIEISLRAHAKQPQILMVEFCQKNILPFAAECQWLGFQTRQDALKKWQTLTKTISFKSFFQQPLSSITPFDLNLLNRGLQDNLDIRSVKVTSPDSEQLILNSEFNNHFDNWYFSVGNTLAWTIDNLWVSLFFEMGLIGLIVFILFTFLISKNLAAALSKGNAYSLAIIAAILGMLIIGSMGSPLDEPRISWLFYLMLFLAALETRPD